MLPAQRHRPHWWGLAMVYSLVATGSSLPASDPHGTTASPVTPSNATPTMAHPLLPGATLVHVNARRVPVVTRSEDTLLLVQVNFNGYPISESLPVYPLKDRVLVPLGELCRILQLAIEVDPTEGVAKGWYIEAKRTFRFDTLSGRVVRGTQIQTVDPRRYELQAQEIFVEATLFSEWLPIDLELDLRGANLNLKPRVRLPIQDFWERNQRIQRENPNLRSALDRERKTYLPLRNDHAWAEPPVIDQTLRLGMVSKGTSRTSVQSTTLTTGDLFGLEHQAYLGLTNQGREHRDFRMTLGRKDPGAGLLGPMGATQFQVGDVMHLGTDLVMSGSYAKGLMVSNQPLNLDYQFDRRTFRGNLPPGWQVELYHNAGLVSIQNVQANGIYEFLEVPMHFGPNEYKLVFYGPLGERREETHRSDISQLQVPKGAFRYTMMGQRTELEGNRGLFQGDYGLSQGLSVGLAYANLALVEGPDTRQRHGYTSLNLRSSSNWLASQVTVARVDSGRLASQLSLQSGFGFSTFQLRHTQVQEGFTSDYFRAGSPKRSTDFTANLTGFAKGSFNSLGAAFGGRRDEYHNLRFSDTYYARLSMALGGLFVSNDLQRVRQGTTLGANRESTTTGSLSASRQFHGFGLRSSLGYVLRGRHEVSHVVLSGNALLGGGYLNFQVTHDRGISSGSAEFNVPRTKDTLASLSYQRQLSHFSLGADLAHGTRSGWQGNLTLRTTLRREPRMGTWSASNTPATNLGAISALAYVDLNGNGQRDPGEPVKSGVGFTVNGFSGTARTNADGIAHITGVQANGFAFIKVDNSSMEDPLWKSHHPGFRVPCRPGHAALVELPVTAESEVDGTAFTMVAGLRREVSGVLVELVDASGETVRKVRSAFDGYFLFQKLTPGTYTLRVHPEDALKRGVKPGTSRTLTLLPKGTQLDGQDLEVTLLPPAKPMLEVPERRPKAAPSAASSPAPSASPATAPRAVPSLTPRPTVRPQPKAKPVPASPTLVQRPMAWLGSNLRRPLPRPRAARTVPVSLPASTMAYRGQKVLRWVDRQTWVLRLEVTSGESGLARAYQRVQGRQTQLFSLPMGGRPKVHQIFLGPFATREEALAVRRSLPLACFRQGRHPLLLRLGRILPPLTVAP